MITPILTDLSALQHVLSKAGITPSRAMGQNYLVSPEVVQAAVAVAKEGPAAITELGSGIGTLTQGLASLGYPIRAIEKDREAAAILPTVLSPKQREYVEIIEGDLKDITWEWNEPYQVFGNIPYNISGLIIRRLVQLDPAPTQAVLLVQKEVGQRMYAKVPDMSLLSLAVQLWGTATRLLSLPPNCFWPQPKVHSELILFTPHTPEKLSVTEREQIMSLARGSFQQKRKQVQKTLSETTLKSAEDIKALLSDLHISPTVRPQELSAEQWMEISRRMSK